MAINPGGQSAARPASSTSPASSSAASSREFSRSSGAQRMQPTNDLLEYCRTYTREKPEMAALICFGVGFVLGWKLKPW